jgi:hypothetical protein
VPGPLHVKGPHNWTVQPGGSGVGFAVVPPALIDAIVWLNGEVVSVGGKGPGIAVAAGPRNHLGCTLTTAL